MLRGLLPDPFFNSAHLRRTTWFGHSPFPPPKSTYLSLDVVRKVAYCRETCRVQPPKPSPWIFLEESPARRFCRWVISSSITGHSLDLASGDTEFPLLPSQLLNFLLCCPAPGASLVSPCSTWEHAPLVFFKLNPAAFISRHAQARRIVTLIL